MLTLSRTGAPITSGQTHTEELNIDLNSETTLFKQHFIYCIKLNKITVGSSQYATWGQCCCHKLQCAQYVLSWHTADVCVFRQGLLHLLELCQRPILIMLEGQSKCMRPEIKQQLTEHQHCLTILTWKHNSVVRSTVIHINACMIKQNLSEQTIIM